MVIGHQEQQKILRTAADENVLSHAYLFFGPTGVGKRTTALHLAGYLETGKWEVPVVFLDTLIIEPDGSGSIGIDAARSVKTHLTHKPFRGSSRIVIIDRAESFTPETQNALLKVSEESPESALIIFVTRDPDALLPTLLSRLHKHHFSGVPVDDISNWLISLKIPTIKAKEIAKQAEGAPGIAWQFIYDEKFLMWRNFAEQFKKVSDGELTTFLKKITDKDDFNLAQFLKALILVESLGIRKVKNKNIWHALLNVRMNADRYNLNPKIQLRALHRVMRESQV